VAPRERAVPTPVPDGGSPLFAGLPPTDEMARDVEALLPYAELLRELVDRRLYPRGGTDLTAPSDDALFDQALRVALERMVADRLAALTPAEFAAAYRSVQGDPAFADALERLADQQRAEVARRTALLRMQHEAQVSGRVRLAELDAGETINIGLFDPRRPDLAARRFAGNAEVRPLHRELRVRLVKPAEGEVQVVRDSWVGPIWAEELRSPQAEPMARGRLSCGSAPEITAHAPIEFEPRAGSSPEVTRQPSLRPPQIVGYVETLDGTLLLDGRPT